MARLTDKKIMDAIDKANGVISVVADHLGVTRKAIYDKINKNDKLKEWLYHVRERTIDFAEVNIQKHMKSKDPWLSFSATKYYLSTMGKSRGFTTKIEKDNDDLEDDYTIEYTGPYED